ncbi:MAG: carboxypeptidase-like regulatory domain-containing protein [Planctomycetota bacterium]
MPRRARKFLLLAVGVVVVGLLLLMSGLFQGLLGGGGDSGPSQNPDATEGGLSGQVLSASGRPAPPGVRVTIRGERGSFTRETDERGWFRFDSVPRGASLVEAKLGPLLSRVPMGSDPMEIRLPGRCRIAGRVVDGTTTEPVRLAVVRCGQLVAQVGERGGFSLEDVPVPDARPPLIDVSAPTHRRLGYRPPLTGDWEDLYLRMDAR